MLKIILLELAKSYVASKVPAKKKYSHIFVYILFLIAFASLVAAEYFYFYSYVDHERYVQALLLSSTVLFLVAMLTQLFSTYLKRNMKYQAYSAANSLKKLAAEILPIAVRLIPVGIIGYVVFSRIRTKMGGENFDWRNLLKRPA